MPLIKSSSPKAFKENVRTLMHEVGKSPHVKSREQALAIAYSTQRRSKALGGEAGLSKYAQGGKLGLRMPRVNGFRNRFKHLQHGGFIDSEVPGRTDKHYVTVPSGSYVLPADHVSALGQNNSNAGAEIVKGMFGPGTKFGPRLSVPRFANGGSVEPVPIVVAGGEVILPPHVVRRIGSGDLDKGHSVLDKWVMETRKKHITKLKSLKPPKGS